MKNLLIRLTFAGVIMMGVSTVSAPVVKAATCATSASWATFQATGTCEIGNIQLSNFNLVSTANPSGSALPASSINLTLDNTVAGHLSMQWNMGLGATGIGNFKDLFFTYVLTGLNGVAFNGDILNFNGAATGGATAGVSSTVCTSGPINTCPSGNLYQTDVVNPPPILASSMSFPASMMLWASKDMVVTGATDGTSSISSVTNTYTYESGVPEPGTYALIGAGLTAVAMLHRRRRFENN